MLPQWMLGSEVTKYRGESLVSSPAYEQMIVSLTEIGSGGWGAGGRKRSRSPFCSSVTNINMPFVWQTKVRTLLFIFSSLALSQILFQTSFQKSCTDLKPNFHMKAGNKHFLFKKSIQLKIYSPVEYKYRLSKNKQASKQQQQKT